jgi:flagellar biosynthetic protein FliR
MPWSLTYLYGFLPAFLLVLFRISGLVLAAPLFSSPLLPNQFKVLLCVGMSLAVFPMMLPHVTVPVTLGSAAAGLVGELAIGVLIGLGISLVFAGIQMAGQLISQQAGLSLGDVFNPAFESSTTVVSEIYFYVSTVIFLAVGGDRAMIRALLESFRTIPPLSFESPGNLSNVLVSLLTLSFTIAIRVGGPTMLALLLAFVALGFISRTVPQLNLLTIGFPVKLALAMAMMAMTMISLEPALLDGVHTCMDALARALRIA